MSKIGRNQLCPCGSGKKYKRCHGSSNGHENLSNQMPSDLDKFVQQTLAKHEAEREQREKQQGLGRPIVSWEHNGTRMVAVGNTVYHSKEWGTFHDFLRFFLIDIFGRDWFQNEIRKSENGRHPVLQWHEMMKANMAKHGKKSGTVYTVPASGAHHAFMHLAYNIYLIAHHAEPKQLGLLLGALVGKLKSARMDDFIGKLFETYAAAAFLKAGFQLDYKELEKSAESTVEFVATFPKTGRKFSVEVKSRVRQRDEDESAEDYKRLRVASKLNRALAKKADHDRVVMIEVNVPDQLSGERVEG
jgi:SEC-C motif